MKSVFVSGCYDMLHSGHVAFFEEAASYGDLYVGIGSDKTLYELKGRKPINSEGERLYMIKSIKHVKDAWINSGSGLLDYEPDLRSGKFKPDIFFVNSDGHSVIKENFCKELGIHYIVGERIPHKDLPQRSTTSLREECLIPYRIDLAGGWLDQPEVSVLYPGAVLTISIEPDYEFNDRSGMSTSSRKKAIDLWQIKIPPGDREQLAKVLFSVENPPGSKYISGSQDSLGIVMPGLNKLDYNGSYWPEKITSILDDGILSWLEKRLWLLPLYPRYDGFDPLADTNINKAGAAKLSNAAGKCWEAMLAKDTGGLGHWMRESFDAQIAMYPNMVTPKILGLIQSYKDSACGWKLCGAGGGGYIVLVSDKPIEKTIQIRIRRGDI
ncbi:MAG: adenylyltransferase/cytidyltransferase family protein [Spirochaetaceae bacterium]|jgi:cytidyltransferase-like protein|nr:adenylyltransferase/cytidyltransferase family protein [Spirochaetaceae bacterium]